MQGYKILALKRTQTDSPIPEFSIGFSHTQPPLPQKPFKVLVFNRGEIAERVLRACRTYGIPSVAVSSNSDQDSHTGHTRLADEQYILEGTPLQAYLDIDQIIRIAIKSGADAIHPGYGFLAESEALAQACAENGIKFIGPSADVISIFGDKISTKDLARECNIPTIPGSIKEVTLSEAKAFAEEHGYPIILKAPLGGGGRGIRIVKEESELVPMFNEATEESRVLYKDTRLFAEKFVSKAQHIEVQFLADREGNAVHLFDRNCSIQRRNQKVLEIAPALHVQDSIREQLRADALKIVNASGYEGAGTVEFLVTDDGEYYLLEINPRLQVEHTVSEEVTGVDIVRAQLGIAAGATLPELGLTQKTIEEHGVAIQCRMTTEKPERNFEPSTGTIRAFQLLSRSPQHVRIDGSPFPGRTITSDYDSLLCKITAKGDTLEEAAAIMSDTIEQSQINGVTTNLWYHWNLLHRPEFFTGEMHTRFIDGTPELSAISKSFLEHQQFTAALDKKLDYLARATTGLIDHKGAKGQMATITPPIVPTPSLDVPQGKAQSALAPPPGWKQLLEQEGPDGFARALRAHQGPLVTDTTMRDAHQSLNFTRYRTHDLLQIAHATAHVLGDAAASVEMWGGATFDVAHRFLKEDAWERVTELRKLIPNIPFQMLLRCSNAVGYTSYPDNVIEKFCEEAVKAGIDIFRLFDANNDIENLKFATNAVKKAGGVVEASVCYSGDLSSETETKYTLEYYLDLAQELVDHGIHILAIKDMAGLLKPEAATTLVTALRERFPDMPIHIHTHDTAGTGSESMVAALNAGADIVDCANESVSGCTSQPSIGRILGLLEDTELPSVPIDPRELNHLTTYWKGVRQQYAPYEKELDSVVGADVYKHQIPGGQLTNLWFQADEILGSEHTWEELTTAYAIADKLLGGPGGLVKVTPVSKVVGDLAIYMVLNGIGEEIDLTQITPPPSVLDFLQGKMGTPPGGFEKPLRTNVLQAHDLIAIEGRPGAAMEPLDFEALQEQLSKTHPTLQFSERALVTAALFPAVNEDYLQHLEQYGDISSLSTPLWFSGLEIGQEHTIQITPNRAVRVKLLALSELDKKTNKQIAKFEIDGKPYQIEVGDAIEEARVKTDKSNPGSIGAPSPGTITKIMVETGQKVNEGDELFTIEAMKMQITIRSAVSGFVSEIELAPGQKVDTNDLVLSIAPPLAESSIELLELSHELSQIDSKKETVIE
jgi:pyruvate carboxylase